MDRREFLKKGSLLTGGAMTGPIVLDSGAKPQEFRIGMAASMWLTASPSTKTYWDACRELASLGIRATEADNGQALLDTAYGQNPAEFKHESAKYRMMLTGVYQGLRLHEKDKLPEMRRKIAQVAKFLKSIDALYIALGWDIPEPVGGRPYHRTAEDVKTAIRIANELAKVSQQEAGIPVGYHAERDQTKEIILQVIEETDPEHVHWIADVGHLEAAGLDPVDMVKTYWSRLYASHWKDFDPKQPAPDFYGSEAKGDFVEVGRGIVNFPALADLFKGMGFKGWVAIEQDTPRQKSGFLESAREMRAYVTEKLRLRMYGDPA